jgi:hypothetical protein
VSLVITLFVNVPFVLKFSILGAIIEPAALTRSVPLNVKLASALAVFVPPSDVKTLLSVGLVIVVNPGPCRP